MEMSANISDHSIMDMQRILQEPLLYNATMSILGVTNHEDEDL